VRVEIWSDVACPWCYIGKARFEQGLAAFAHKKPREQIERRRRGGESDTAKRRHLWVSLPAESLQALE